MLVWKTIMIAVRWFLGSKGLTIAAGVLTAGQAVAMFALTATILNEVLAALTGVGSVAVSAFDQLSDKAGGAAGSVGASTFMPMVNYILPVDFLATCFSLWCSIYTTTLVIRFWSWVWEWYNSLKAMQS